MKLAKPKPVAFCSEIISDPISGCGGCRHGAACSACLPAAPLSHHRTNLQLADRSGASKLLDSGA